MWKYNTEIDVLNIALTEILTKSSMLCSKSLNMSFIQKEEKDFGLDIRNN